MLGNLFLDFMREYWTHEETVEYIEIMDLISVVKEDYPDNIDYLIYSAEDSCSINEITLILKNAIREMLIELLLNIGVKVSDKYDLDNHVLYQIYKEMISIEDNEQVEFSLSILSSKEDIVSVFHELLSTVGGLTIDESTFSQHVQSISVFTKEKLIQVLRSKLYFKEEEEEFSYIQSANKVKQFIEKLGEDFFVIELIRNDVALGLPFSSYLNLYKEDLFSSVTGDNEQMDLRELSFNLFLIGLISRDGVDNPVEAIENHIQNYLFDMKEIDTVLRMSREIQLKLGIY